MQNFDTKALTEKQYRTLTQFLYRLKWEALDNREELEKSWEDVDFAIKQCYSQDAYYTQGENNAEDEEGEDEEESELSEMFSPMSYRLFKSWVTHLKEALIPKTGDWFSVNRQYSSFFDELGINGFLSIMNNCWERNILVENERFGITKKLKRAIAQFVAYGATPGEAYYDPSDEFVNLLVMPLRDFGVYPITDNWIKSNRIYRYPVNYVDLLQRQDFDQEAIKEIRPWLEFNAQDGGLMTPSQRSSQYEEEQSPYGTVMIYEAHCPSLFLPNNENPEEDILEKEARFIFCINPRMKPNSTFNQTNPAEQNIIILKATKDISAMEVSSFFATFDEVLPYQLHGKGPIIPFLIYQRLQNALIAGMSEDVSREMNPPIQIISGEKDIDDTPLQAFKHSAVYKGVEVKPLSIPGLDQRMQAFLTWTEHLDNKVEEGTGMTKTSTGGREPTRRSKYELQERIDAGSLRIADPGDLFNEGLLQRYMTNRVIITQNQLEFEVEDSVQNLMQIDKTLINNPLEAYKIVLQNNSLFKRLLDFTGVEPKYKEFYKTYQSRKNKNDQFTAEYESYLAQMMSLQSQLAKPAQPFIEPTNQSEFDPATIKLARENHYQLQQENRNNLKNSLLQVQLKAKETQLLIEDLKEIPEPDMYFYYLLLIEPMSESDIIIYGANSTLNKAMKRRGSLELLETLLKLPAEILIEYDLKKIVDQYSTVIDMPFELVRKPQEEIDRSKQQQQQMMVLAKQQNASTQPQ